MFFKILKFQMVVTVKELLNGMRPRPVESGTRPSHRLKYLQTSASIQFRRFGS